MGELLAFASAGSALSLAATSETRHPETLPLPSTKLVEPADYLFVYGSLMRAGARASVLASERFEGEAYITDAQLFDTGCGFPALFLGREGMVWGEVFKILHPETWRLLDLIEGGLYHRVARRVHLPGKAPMSRHPLAQLYVGNPEVFEPSTLSRIPDGRWKNDANA